MRGTVATREEVLAKLKDIPEGDMGEVMDCLNHIIRNNNVKPGDWTKSIGCLKLDGDPMEIAREMRAAWGN